MSAKQKNSIHSYKSLRRAVGLIGIFLPFILMLGVVIKTGEPVQPSISDYYYTYMGDVFVGALCSVALFMFYYAGEKWIDNWLANAAGVFAIGVAFFPTTCDVNCCKEVYSGFAAQSIVLIQPNDTLKKIQNVKANIAEDKKRKQCSKTVYRGFTSLPITIEQPDETAGKLHLCFASLLFLSFASFSLFIFTRTGKGKTYTRQKKKRNVIYILCGCVMIACLIAIVVFMQLGRNENSRLIYWSEALALVAFGFSWLTKGETLYQEKKQ